MKYSPFEQEDALKNMVILVDTREQPSARAMRRYKRFNCPYSRRKLEYGDYAYNFTLPKQLGPSVINGTSDGHHRVNLSLHWEGQSNVTEQEFVSGGFFTVMLQGSDTNSGSYVVEYYYSPDGTAVPPMFLHVTWSRPLV